MSIFLGDQLTDIFEQLEKGAAKSTKQGGFMDIGVSVLPKLPRDAGDRNRTSPFAFTGNKFEFRAVGVGPEHRLPEHGAEHDVAESLDYIATELEAATQGRGPEGGDRQAAPGSSRSTSGSSSTATTTRPSGTRKPQARAAEPQEHRGRAAESSRREAIKLFDRFKILNEREMHARYEVFLENYIKTINIEGQLMVLMANRYILPAALSTRADRAERGGGQGRRRDERPGQEAARTYTKLVDKLKAQTDVLAKLLDHSGGSAEKHAKYMRDKILPAMAKLREMGDSSRC